MRKLIVTQFMTLDGVVQSPGADGDTEGGFPYGGWQLPYLDDGDSAADEEFHKMGALLLGRKTYEAFAAFWPTTGKDFEPFGPIMNRLPKYVASTTLRTTDWQHSQLLEGDVGKAVSQLKEQAGKDIYVIGSGNLCQTLMNKNLIDEYLLRIHPLVLGAGKRLFEKDAHRQDLELIKSYTTKNGILVARYKVKK